MNKNFSVSDAAAFVRKNPSVIYSVVLVASVTASIFWNSYYALSRFEQSAGELLVSKAAVAEKVFGVLSSDSFADPASLQPKIDRLTKEAGSDISAISILNRAPGDDGFSVVASTDPGEVASIHRETPYTLAWSEDAGMAFVSNQGGDRYWNVIKCVTAPDGTKQGLVFFQLSLRDNDAFIGSVMRQVYVVTCVTLFLVILLLLNHLRFSRFALRATKLEEVDRMKDDFVSMASHELKSPITILRGYTDLMKGDLAGPETDATRAQAIEYVGNMEATLERLGTLVDDILNVSRLEQNRLPITVVPSDLGEMLAPLVLDYSVAAEKKGLELRYVPLPEAVVMADPDRVKQILVNVLSNAVKYTPKGTVEVTVTDDRDTVSVTVADSGLGISAEDMEHLFSKFYRVRNAETERISGTGLGLWIAREIARKMGGDLTAESIHGVGSHFTLHLKKAIKNR